MDITDTQSRLTDVCRSAIETHPNSTELTCYGKKKEPNKSNAGRLSIANRDAT